MWSISLYDGVKIYTAGKYVSNSEVRVPQLNVSNSEVRVPLIILLIVEGMSRRRFSSTTASVKMAIT